MYFDKQAEAIANKSCLRDVFFSSQNVFFFVFIYLFYFIFNFFTLSICIFRQEKKHRSKLTHPAWKEIAHT